MNTYKSFIDSQIERANSNLLNINIFVLIIMSGIFALLIYDYRNISFNDIGYIVFIMVGIVLFNILNIYKAWLRRKDPRLHPIFRNLEKIGPPQDVAAKINEEVGLSSFNFKSYVITNTWFIKQTIFGIEINLVGELAWVHKKVTQHSVNMIPTGSTYSVIIYKRDGNSKEINCSEEEADRLMLEIMQRAPWVVIGYKAEIQNLWDNDRKGFIAYIDQQKLINKMSRK